MIGTHHQDLTRRVALAVFPDDDKLANEIADAAVLPDEMQDIVAGKFGTSIVGHRTGALTHFCVPTTGGHFRGYSWEGDKSLCKLLRRFDPRTGPVNVYVGQWVQIVGKSLALRHPLAELIRDLYQHATLDADNFTFPTSATMAGWIWRSSYVLRAVGPRPIACILHMIQDACVEHHARGWLAKGHAKTEGAMADLWLTNPKLVAEALVWHWPPVDFATLPREPRAIVEMVADGTYQAAKHGEYTPELANKRAAFWTRWFLDRVVKEWHP